MVVVQRKKTKQHLYIVMAISFIIASLLSVYPLSAEIRSASLMCGAGGIFYQICQWLFTPIVLELGMVACGRLFADLSTCIDFSAFIYPRGVCTPITLYRCCQ